MTTGRVLAGVAAGMAVWAAGHWVGFSKGQRARIWHDIDADWHRVAPKWEREAKR